MSPFGPDYEALRRVKEQAGERLYSEAEVRECEAAAVVGAYEAAAQSAGATWAEASDGDDGPDNIECMRRIRTLTPADAQAALDRKVNEARLEEASWWWEFLDEERIEDTRIKGRIAALKAALGKY